MELLLNLAWLLLALPAYILWRDAKGASARHAFTSLQCFLALGCMLVLLFPVVSATDDLRAMRPEMEESPAAKRSMRQASNDKPPAWKWRSPPALAETSSFLLVSDQGWQTEPTLASFTPTAPAIERTGRAPPPPSFLG